MLVGYARAVDGDTIQVAGVLILLKVVAAPELNEAFGSESTAMVARMINGQTVLCRLTGERSHQRGVGFCSVDGQAIGNGRVSGLARDCPRFSAGQYSEAEAAARSNGCNLAEGCPLPRYCTTP